MPQAQTVSLHDYLAVGMKAIELEKQGKFEEAEKLEYTNMTSAQVVYLGKQKETLG